MMVTHNIRSLSPVRFLKERRPMVGLQSLLLLAALQQCQIQSFLQHYYSDYTYGVSTFLLSYFSIQDHVHKHAYSYIYVNIHSNKQYKCVFCVCTISVQHTKKQRIFYLLMLTVIRIFFHIKHVKIDKAIMKEKYVFTYIDVSSISISFKIDHNAPSSSLIYPPLSSFLSKGQGL